MEGLADRFGTEVTVVCLVNDQLVLTAAAGHTTSPDRPTRVGLRLPFMPPVGSVNAGVGAAWNCASDGWLTLHPGTSPARMTARMKRRRSPQRPRGYTITLGHELSAEGNAPQVAPVNRTPTYRPARSVTSSSPPRSATTRTLSTAPNSTSSDPSRPRYSTRTAKLPLRSSCGARRGG